MKISNRFFTNWEIESHFTRVAAIMPSCRTGVRNSKLFSASRIRTVLHIFVYRFIFKGFDSFRQTKPHSKSFPYSNSPTSNSLKPREIIKEFHSNASFVCVDRSVEGLMTLWRTGSFYLFHSGWFSYSQMEWE